MTFVYCHWIKEDCYDYIGKCANCESREKALREIEEGE